MDLSYLKNFFAPTSIAVIGASNKPNSVGRKVFKNLISNEFQGQVFAVNPKHHEIQGKPCVAKLSDLTIPIDLAIITTPAVTVPGLIAECGEAHIQCVIILSAGFSETGPEGKALEAAMLANAKKYNVRLIGPNCLGVMRPSIGMNASFDNNKAIADGMALVSQSGALCAGILDWAMNKKIGFSSIISLGNGADLGFGDLLEFLAEDTETKSILLYIEGIHDAKRFMDGLRKAARKKPVIAIKAGRHSQGSRAALSHTGALIGDDDVFDTALRTAGVVRVLTIEDLFSAAEILSGGYPKAQGNKLAIVTNGGGAGVMAADCAVELDVALPPLSDALTEQLNKVLPPHWSHQNPVDIIGDAPPQRYHAALDLLANDHDVDGVLTILVPVAMAKPLEVAKQVINDAKAMQKPMIACWMGEKQVASSWKLFEKNKVPCFDTPERAVQAFSYLARYQRHQAFAKNAAEKGAPISIPENAMLKINKTLLTSQESKQVLKSFAIPVTEQLQACTKEEAIAAGNQCGYPLAMKINSPDITHKKDVGGVMLNILNPTMLGVAFETMLKQVKLAAPDANILGVTVERMLDNPNNRELLVGVIHDKVFGPVITFGAGGTFVEIMRDRALALPPLNAFVANDLIARTKIAKTLGAFRSQLPVNIDKLVDVLLRISAMTEVLPHLMEMDINPLIINDKEVVAADARMVFSP